MAENFRQISQNFRQKSQKFGENSKPLIINGAVKRIC